MIENQTIKALHKFPLIENRLQIIFFTCVVRFLEKNYSFVILVLSKTQSLLYTLYNQYKIFVVLSNKQFGFIKYVFVNLSFSITKCLQQTTLNYTF